MKTSRVRRNQGFLLIRKVISREHDDSLTNEGNCVRYSTDDIHPLEIFSRFEVNSTVDKPIRTSYIPRKKGSNSTLTSTKVTSETMLRKQLRSRPLDLPKPYTGLTSCLDESFWDPTDPLLLRWTDGSIYALDIYGFTMCAEYANDFGGGFNFNYNPSTKSASTTDITIVNGITCHIIPCAIRG